MNQITIRNQSYLLPEGFTCRKTRGGIAIDDATGRSCELYLSGYTSKADDDQPFITTGGRRIALQKLEPEIVAETNVNTGSAWVLSNKILKMLMDGGKLATDHEEKLAIIEDEFEKFGDAALKDHVLGRIKQVVATYKLTGIWDFASLGK